MGKTTEKTNEMAVIVKAKELCSYVMVVTQKSPKQFRFTYIGRLQNLSLDIIEKIYRANEVYVGGSEAAKYLRERREFQNGALTGIKLLAYISQLALEQRCILPKQYEQIAQKTTDCQYLLAAWINSDNKRFSSQGVSTSPSISAEM